MLDNIKMTFKDKGWDGVDGICWFHKTRRISWLLKALLTSQKKPNPLI